MTEDIKKDYSTKQAEKEENSLNNSDADSDWGKHPNSIKALEQYQFRKGKSGNPLGSRPTYKNLKEELKKLGEEETMDWLEDKNLGTRKSQVLKTIWNGAIKGDIKKIQLLIWLGCLE